MIKIYEDNISDLGESVVLGTSEYLYEKVMENAYPAIYIESPTEIEYSNGIITSNSGNITIAGKTLLDVVIEMQAIGIVAYLTSKNIGLMPAELLVKYGSSNIDLTDINISPKPLAELHTRGIINVPGLNEDSIAREILAIYSHSIAVDNSKSNGYHTFSVDSSNIYIDGLAHDTKCLYRYTASKFFLYASDKSVLDANKMLLNDKESASSKMLANSINAINTDKL